MPGLEDGGDDSMEQDDPWGPGGLLMGGDGMHDDAHGVGSSARAGGGAVGHDHHLAPAHSHLPHPHHHP